MTESSRTITRRQLLRMLATAGAYVWGAPVISPNAALEAVPGVRNLPATPRRKLVVIQFGGGVRQSETIGDPRHRFIPHLWQELVPRGTLCVHMRVEGKVVHPNSTGSMMTGHWEWDHLDWTQPLAHPTLFEVFRQNTPASDLKSWAFVYASILARISESSAPGYGPAFSANVVVPPTIPRSTAEEVNRLMQSAARTGSTTDDLQAARASAELVRTTSRISLEGLRSNSARALVENHFSTWKQNRTSTSHDAFLADSAIACMTQFAPEVLVVCFGEIDCAHYGSWSRYVEAIQQTDALVWRLWQTTQALEEYRDQTLLLILPDHGRELDESGGLGFVHHSDFYTGANTDEGCRRVWMLMLGPGVPSGNTLTEPIPITSVAATGLEYLQLPVPPGAARSVWPRLDCCAKNRGCP